MEDIESKANETATESLVEKQLAEIGQAFIVNQGVISAQVYDKTISKLFTLIPDLETIQKNIRLKVCRQTYVKTLKPEEVLINDQEEAKGFYILMEGALLFSSAGSNLNISKEAKRYRRAMKAAEEAEQNDDPSPAKSPYRPEQKGTFTEKSDGLEPGANQGKRIMKPGELFGDLTLITQKKWRHANVYALEDSTVLLFNNANINRIIKELSSKAEYQELLAFITLVYPDFATASASQQRKMMDCFKAVEFIPKHYIIKEGETDDKAYLIKDGECIYCSTKNPLEEVNKTANLKTPLDVDLRTIRGFMSSTTTSFQFGLLQKNQWAGEERLLREKDEPSNYSIITRTNVKAYAISREEASKKFTREFIAFIEKIAKQRTMWIKERANALVNSTMDITYMDPSDMKYEDHLAETKKKFPIALPHVLTSIRKKDIARKYLYGGSLSHSVPPDMLSVPEVSVQELEPNKSITIKKGSFVDASASQEVLLSPTPNPTEPPAADKSTPAPQKNKGLSLTLMPGKNQAKHLMQMSLKPASKENAISNATLKLPIILNKDTPKSMSLATSMPKGLQLNSFAPVLSKASYVDRWASIRTHRAGEKNEKIDKVLSQKFNIEMDKKNLNKFMVGKRVINLLGRLSDEKPGTPNPFEEFITFRKQKKQPVAYKSIA